MDIRYKNKVGDMSEFKDDLVEKVAPIIYESIKYSEKENYLGYDPYDAMNGSIVKLLNFNNKYFKIAWIQLLKNLPINIRPFLKIRKGHNPKALGLFLNSYAKLYYLKKNDEYLKKLDKILYLIQDCKSSGYSGNSWGYNFDWQSRAFYVPKYTPTIVNTGFIGHALINAYEYTGKEVALEMAVPIKEFILNDLYRTKKNDTFCFSYTPIDKTVVHNANLIGSSLLIRLYEITGEKILRDTALESIAYTMNYQNDDGSWYYAQTRIQNWVDSFHTAYNLESIRCFLDLGVAEEFRGQYEKGRTYYINNFFLSDGTPKYYNNKTYPIDIHSPSAAIVYLSREGNRYRSIVEKIITWTINNMYDYKGYFYFRKGKIINNKIPYMRWSQAWAIHAFTEYYLNAK